MKNESGDLKKSEVSEILFVERCIDLAKGGGGVGVVLPDSAFTNKGNIPVVEYVMSRCEVLAVVSVPQLAFSPYGSNVKTSLLFLKKKEDGKNVRSSYRIFMAHVEHVGYDATNRVDVNDLPLVLEEWNKFKKRPGAYPIHRTVKPGLWMSAVERSAISSKLDVEAYGEPFIKTVAAIKQTERTGAKVVNLSDICEAIFAGVGPKKSDYALEDGIPVVKTGTVRKVTQQVGVIEWSTVQFVADKGQRKADKYLRKNDILIQSVAHTKDYIGDKIAIVEDIPFGDGKALALSKFLIVRPNPELVDPTYLLVFLSSRFAREQLRHFIRGMTAEIYEFDLRSLLVSLPSAAEQKRIAELHRSRLARCESLSKEIAEARRTLEGLEDQVVPTA
jgi:type I restriction enzyme M protein